ncbi:MAG: threonylcarbamoyl-AMP synthase [Candidatus Pacebacteria bacterium]|nr:threonylcarbamoyl-AMP synthase [Candidatus Paceibacterota bacterium]
MKEIVSILKKGGIGVFPTDTLYGLVGSAGSRRAVERIYAVKKRDTKKPLIVLISKWSDLEAFGIKLTKSQMTYARRVWPGRVSIIFPCPDKKLSYLHRGTGSIAIRFPRNKVLQLLLRKTGPLVAPSANPESLPPAETVREARDYFGDTADFYYPGGRKKGNPSRLIRLSSDGIPETLR